MKKILLLLAALSFDAAHAQTNLSNNQFIDQIQSSDAIPEHSQDKYFGVYLAEVPKYQGSSEMKTELVVDVQQEWSNGILVVANSWKPYDSFQVGKHLSSIENLDYGVLVGAGLSRSSFIDDGEGNGNKDWMPFAGGFLKYKLSEDIQINSEALYYFGQFRGGAYADLNVIKNFPITDHQTLAFSAGTVLANQTFSTSQYGISASQSIAYGYPQYSPSAGVEDVHLSLNWRWSFNSAWMLNSSIYVSHLTSNVSGTRQVQNENNGSLFVGLAYRF